MLEGADTFIPYIMERAMKHVRIGLTAGHNGETFMFSIPDRHRRQASAIASLVMLAALGACSPPPVEESLAESRTAMARGDYRTAEIHLRNVLQQVPEDIEATLLLAENSLHLGKAEAAEGGLRRAALLGAPEQVIRPVRAATLAALGRCQEALNHTDTADVATEEIRMRLLMIRAGCHAEIGAFDEAEMTYQEARHVAPRDPDLMTGLAELELRRNQPETADRWINDALSARPDHVPALMLAGQRQAARLELAAAEATFTRVAALTAQHGSGRGQLVALSQLADVQLQQSHPDDAAKTIATLTRMAPEALDVMFLRARHAAATGQRKDAIGLLQTLLAGGKEHAGGQRLLGLLSAEEGNLEVAEMYLAPVLAKAPDDRQVRQVLDQIRLQRNGAAEALRLLDGTRPGTGELSENALIAAATASLRNNRSDMALLYFDRGAGAFPDDPRFIGGMASTLLARGDHDGAITTIESPPGRDIPEPTRTVLLSIAHAGRGDSARALDLARALVAAQPDAAWAHNLLGSHQRNVGNVTQAREAFEAALAIAPDDIHALRQLASLDQSLGQHSRAFARLERILAIDPGDDDALRRLVFLHLGYGNTLTAKRLLAVAPDNATARELGAEVALAEGRNEEAAALAIALRTSSPRNPRLHDLYGRCRLATGDADKAISAFESAQRLAPSIATYPIHLAHAYLADGNGEAAALAIARARRIDAAHPALAELEFSVAMTTGDLTAAEDHLQRWMESAPDDHRALYAQATLATRRGQRTAAMHSLERIIAAYPDHVQALNDLAWLHASAGDARRSLPLAERAHALAGDDPRIMDTLGWARLRSGDPAGALPPLQAAAMRLGDSSPEVHYHYALALVETGDQAAAALALTRALAMDRPFPSREDAEKALARIQDRARQAPGPDGTQRDSSRLRNAR